MGCSAFLCHRLLLLIKRGRVHEATPTSARTKDAKLLVLFISSGARELRLLRHGCSCGGSLPPGPYASPVLLLVQRSSVAAFDAPTEPLARVTRGGGSEPYQL